MKQTESPAELLSVKVAKEKSHIRGALYKRNVLWVCELRRRRQEYGLTLHDVSRATGVSRASLSNMERGAEPSFSAAMTLAKFFSCHVEQLWERRTEEAEAV